MLEKKNRQTIFYGGTKSVLKRGQCISIEASHLQITIRKKKKNENADMLEVVQTEIISLGKKTSKLCGVVFVCNLTFVELCIHLI